MPKLTVHNAVVKGHHAYGHLVAVGDTYVCSRESENIHDPTAVAVYSGSQLVGHAPSGFCSAVSRLLRHFMENIQVFWYVAL